jgi:outer membrane protein OmpA-like peptidoglycan-associated protein
VVTEEGSADDESFGPGTDMVLSLFAVLLVVAVFSFVILSRVKPAAAHAEQQIDVLRTKLARLEREKAGLEAAARAAQTLQAKVSSLELEIERLRRISIGQQLVRLEEKTDAGSTFSRNEAVLTSTGIDALDVKVATLLAELGNGRFNQLRISGFASPELTSGDERPGERPNLDLSQRRANAVADHLRSRGIPYECMTVEGIGRARSASLVAWISADPARSVARFDRGGGIAESQLEHERRVEIWGLIQKDSVCELALRSRPEPERVIETNRPSPARCGELERMWRTGLRMRDDDVQHALKEMGCVP